MGVSSLRNNDQTAKIWFGAVRPEGTLAVAQFAHPPDDERGHASFRLTFIKVRNEEPATVASKPDGFGTIAVGEHWWLERFKRARPTHPERGNRSWPIAIRIECDIQDSPGRCDYDSPRSVTVDRSGRSVGRKPTAWQNSEPRNIVRNRIRRPQSPAIWRHGDDK